jgi:hypothetical protein
MGLMFGSFKEFRGASNFVTFQDFIMTWILNTQVSKREELEESLTLEEKTIGMQQWNHALWAQNHYRTKSFSLGDHVLWFPKTCKKHTCKFKQRWI